MKNSSILALLLIAFSFAEAQFPMKKLSRSVTNNTEDEIAPFLSMDGNTLLYTRKRAMDEHWKVQISKKTNGTWQRPQELKILNSLPKLRLLGSYCINNDANEIIFVSKRRGGIGNFDLWKTKLKSGNWTEPTNLAKPINSSKEEVNPIFSTDGKSIYFVRRASGQKNGDIMISIKKGSYYSTPVKIDFGGQFFCPRLAPDNKTMYLSKVVNEETELFISRKENGAWTKATKVKGYTKTNDKYFTISSTSTNLLVSAKKDNTYDLFYKKLSEEYKSIAVTRVTYEVNVPYKSEIKEETSTNFKNTPKTGAYLSNDQNYTVKIKTKDYFNSYTSLNLDGSKSNKTLVKPTLIEKTKTAELPLFISGSEKLETEKLELQLKAISSSLSSHTHELVVYQKNISTDTVQSETYNKDVSYYKDITTLTDGVETTDTNNTIKKRFPLFSNDKTEAWENHVQGILTSNNISTLDIIILNDDTKGEFNTSGLFIRPKQ